MMKIKIGTLLALAAVLVALLFILQGCADKMPPPEPQIVIKTADIAVSKPCKPTLGPRPALKTKNEIRDALIAAPNIDDKIHILTEQLLLYVGWVPVLEAGLDGCGGGGVGNR